MGNAKEALTPSCHSCSFVLGKKITFHSPHLLFFHTACFQVRPLSHLHDLSNIYRYLRSMELSIWEHKASEWYVKIIGRISITESRLEKLMQMFPSYHGSLAHWSMEKRIEGKLSSSFALRLGSLISVFSIPSPPYFQKICFSGSSQSLLLHLFASFLQHFSFWASWWHSALLVGCVGVGVCVKHPRNSYQQTYLPSVLQ